VRAVEAVSNLREVLAEVELPLRLPGVEEAERARVEAIDQVDDYVLPRLARLDAPLLAVLGGSTGAGKSTITNSLAGREVTPAGVLRPTTRRPVLVCHPDDEAWFLSPAILPELPRTTGGAPGTGAGLHVTTSDHLPQGLALLDSPDIDSVEVANHDLAAQLLGAADLWLFVTTAVRYADAVPWDYLARASERAVALGIVVNRVPPGAEGEIGPHLASMLAERGLRGTRLMTVPEGDPTDGLLGDELEPVRTWLRRLVANAVDREALVRHTLEGVVSSLPRRAERVAEAVDDQARAAAELGAVAERRYAEACQGVERALLAGSLLRDEVFEQFREQVGTGELADWLQRGVGRVRDRVAAAVGRRELPEAEVQGAIESTLAMLVREHADEAALRTVESWQATAGGRQALDAGEPLRLSRSSAELAPTLERAVEEWQRDVMGFVQRQAGSRVLVGRIASWGINGVGVALMVAVFAHTGGLTGGEAAVAGGTAAVSHAVLSAVFGEQAVRTLVEEARARLLVHLDTVLATERYRFERLVALVPDARVAARVRAAAAELGGGGGR
jgi:energy-coupling factor transporter ATP-binding protein EcfA2